MFSGPEDVTRRCAFIPCFSRLLIARDQLDSHTFIPQKVGQTEHPMPHNHDMLPGCLLPLHPPTWRLAGHGQRRPHRAAVVMPAHNHVLHLQQRAAFAAAQFHIFSAIAGLYLAHWGLSSFQPKARCTEPSAIASKNANDSRTRMPAACQTGSAIVILYCTDPGRSQPKVLQQSKAATHLEHVDRILQAAHAVQVLVGGQVAHVALHKHLAGAQPQQLVGLQARYGQVGWGGAAG